MPLIKDIELDEFRELVLEAREGLLETIEEQKKKGIDEKRAAIAVIVSEGGQIGFVYPEPVDYNAMSAEMALELASGIIRSVIGAQPDLALEHIKAMMESLGNVKH